MGEPARSEPPVELVVDQPLADELERRGLRGVHVGDLVRLELIHGGMGDEAIPAYFASFASGQPDLAERSSAILEAEFPGQ